jgi:hypothetical protein
VSGRIDDLAVALAPERVLKGRVHLSPFGQRPLPQFVDRVGRDRERAVRSTDRERRASPKLGEFIGDHHAGIAEAELDLHEPSIRDGNAVADLGAERAFVPLGRARRVADDDVRRHLCHINHLV